MLPNPDLDFTDPDKLRAAELNQLVENVESIATMNGVDDGAIPGSKFNFAKTGADGIWWEEIGRATQSVAGSTLNIASIPARKHLKIRMLLIPNGGTLSGHMRFNSDSGANYAVRVEDNGGTDATGAGSTGVGGLDVGSASANPMWIEFDVVNIATEAKLLIGWITRAQVGAANGVSRREFVAKWHNVVNQITSVGLSIFSGTGNFGVGSEIVVLGHN